MGQFETAICLTLELIKHRMISNHQVGKKFQRHIALQFFVACEPDNPHPASSEDLHQRIAAKDLLSTAELTRCHRCDTARVLVSHLDKIPIIKMKRKVKAGSATTWNKLSQSGRSRLRPPSCGENCHQKIRS